MHSGWVQIQRLLSGEYYMEKKDHQIAWAWWEKGEARRDVNCIERMLRTVDQGLIEKSVEEIDRLALRGARLGSIDSIYRVADAYEKGRLKKHKKEIVTYHMKEYKKMIQWDKCQITGYITACDPGNITTSCNNMTYRPISSA